MAKKRIRQSKASPESIKRTILSITKVRSYLPSYMLIDKKMAEGGQGVVYEGTVRGISAAVKIYFPGQLTKRISREVNALKHIESRTIVKLLSFNIVKIHGQKISIVATALVQGEPLNKVLEKGFLSFNKLGNLAYDVAEAIQEMWAKRIVHRDLKPSNIIMTPDSRACVIDLGVARHLTQSNLTTMGSTWGTTGYLSPEQHRCVRQLSCKSDLFTLGVILVEARLCYHPTQGDQQRLLSRGFHNSLPRPISQWSYANLVKRLLEPRPTKRPKPLEVLSALKKYEPKFV